MVIGLLLVMAAIAGAVCVWLSLRGNARAGKASAAASGPAQPPLQRAATPELVSPPDSSLSAIRRAITPGAALLETQVLNGQQTFHLMYELAFGALAHQVPPPQDLRLISENADSVFDKLATDPKYTMRRPMMLPQLLRAVHDKKSTQHQLANIFARDPALAGNLLKVANSPVYRVSEDPVESLDRAVAMLGTDGLHSLIATVLVQPVFKLPATHYPRFPETVW
jgi:hypothetical protein